jgi:DNA-binding SARP family transcriptional activator
MLSFDLLGPLALRRDGLALPLNVTRTQALLLLLALDGQASRLQLCLMLWPGIPEASARRELRRELARLCEVGAAEAVVVEGDLLRPAPTLSVDFRRAEAALAQGTPDDALALWRGPLAMGLVMDDSMTFEPCLAVARLRVQRVRQRALETSLAAHEARGEPAVALQRVQRPLAEDGLNESHHRDAMRLLAACGQRAAPLR